MNARQARQILSLRRPTGEDDENSSMKKALAASAADPSLAAEVGRQQTFDLQAIAALEELRPDAAAETAIAEAGQALRAKYGGGHRISVKNPASIAVALGFLLLVAVLTWHFLGEAGVFPDEAVKIATMGARAGADQFDPVDNQASQLQDWFALKGFDDFHLPPGLGDLHVVGVRLFKYENEPVAQAAISENTMFFYAFSGQPLGVSVTPEKTWLITEVDRTVIAIRQEKDICFMIAFRGTKAEMEKLLEDARKRAQELALE